MKIRLTKANYFPSLETDKAFAIGFTRKNVHFISKKSCMINKVDLYNWDCIIPDWLLEKNEQLKEDMILLYHENKMNDNTTDFL